jgi:hypothetical protein
VSGQSSAVSRPWHIRPQSLWLGATLFLTVGITALVVVLADRGPDAQPLHTVILLGASVHVASTGWFLTVPSVRAHALAHPKRYIYAPIALVLGTAAAFAVLPDSWLQPAVIAPYVAWQFFHYQKQNLGMASLALVSTGSRSLSPLERRCLIATGVAGIAALFSRVEFQGYLLPWDVGWLFGWSFAAFCVFVVVGVWTFARRRRTVPRSAAVMYSCALVFFVPVFIFSVPLAAGAFAVAHGYQYLLILGLVAGGTANAGRTRLLSLGAFLAIALVGGLLLDRASRGFGTDTAARGLVGAYLGVVMSHFVVDAGIWRLRDKFPREFLGQRVPYLLRPGEPRAERPPAKLPVGVAGGG